MLLTKLQSCSRLLTQDSPVSFCIIPRQLIKVISKWFSRSQRSWREIARSLKGETHHHRHTSTIAPWYKRPICASLTTPHSKVTFQVVSKFVTVVTPKKALAYQLPIWGYPGLPTLRQTIHLVIFCSYDQLCSLWPSLVSPKTIIIQVATDWRFVNYDATDFSWGPGQAGPAAGKGLSVSMLTAVSRSDFWEALSDSRWKVVILKTFTGSIKCIKIL